MATAELLQRIQAAAETRRAARAATAVPIAYDLEYYERQLRQNAATAQALAAIRWQWVTPALHQGAAVLDIGSGVGWFRAWRPDGIEVDTVDVGRYPQTGARRRAYDLVTLWDVLEHLPQAAGLPYLARGAAWLALTVPVLPDGQPLGAWKHYKPGEHLRNYTEAQILDEIEKAGFTVVRRGRPECPPRSDILSLLCRRRAPATPAAARKLIIRQGQSPGDVLTLTRALADLKAAHPEYDIDVRTACPEIFLHNPDLTAIADNDPQAEVVEARCDNNEALGINQIAEHPLHFTDAFRMDLERKLGVAIPRRHYRPVLHVAPDEISGRGQVERVSGWAGPYWILNAGSKPDNALKQYHAWAEVADRFQAAFAGRVRLVQIGHAAHYHPRVAGAINLVGLTGLRDVIRLAAWPECHGVLTPISFPFVLAAALDKPCVVVAGAKEGVNWHIYPNTRWLCVNGALPCGMWQGCWRGGALSSCADLVEGVPRCFTLITPAAVVAAVRQYYDGGRLKL